MQDTVHRPRLRGPYVVEGHRVRRAAIGPGSPLARICRVHVLVPFLLLCNAVSVRTMMVVVTLSLLVKFF